MKKIHITRLKVRRPKALSNKYFKLLFAGLMLGLVISGFLALRLSSVAEAACTAPATTYGTDTMSVNVPSTSTYTIWTRMEAPSTSSNSIMLQVDGANCYNVGGSSGMALNALTWVNYQNGATATPISLSLTAGTHTLELIGTEAGVSVDRILLLSDASCVPTGNGSNCTPPLPVNIPYYQVSGGTGYTDATGDVWQGDQYFTQNNTDGSTGGVSAGADGSSCTTTAANENCTTHAITGTNNQQVYQDERWGDFQYDVPVNNGSYTVVLKFAEINPASGTREANVSIDGTQVLTNFNIATQVGNYAADDQTFQTTVNNGDLNITLTTVDGAAKLSGFEILPQTPPTISLTSPTANSTVSGTSVPISVALSNTDTNATVSYSVDGVAIAINNPTSSKLDTTNDWNSTTVSDGSHTISATVKDNGLSASTSETVNVNNNVCSGTPTAPSSLTDTDSAPLPANKVDLSWTAGQPATNCTLSGYYIYRDGGSTPYATVSSGLKYSDTTVSASTTYTYQVAAFDSAGHISSKVPASPLSVKTGANCSLGSGTPTTPTNLAETGDTYTTITLTWTGSTDSDGCSLSGYHVYRNGVMVGDSNGTSATYSDSGLTSGTSYNYTVVAFDSGGNPSTSSTSTAMSTERDNVAPTVPTNVTAKPVTSNSVDVSWGASTDLPNPGGVGLLGYNIYRDNSLSPTFSVGPTTTSYTDTSVSPGTTYTYAIQAFDKNINGSALTADVSVTTPPAQASCTTSPSVPTGLSSSAQTTSTISLSWGASKPGAGCSLTGYQVYRNDAALPSLVTGTTFTDSGLAANTDYVYSVAAVDSSGPPSAPSGDITVATLPDVTPPVAPTNFDAKAVNSNQVQLTWVAGSATSSSSAITGYDLYRDGNLLQKLGNVLSYVDSTVSPSTSYTYTLKAFDSSGNLSAATTATPNPVTTPAAVVNTKVPSVPGGLQAVAVTSNSVGLTWQASTGTVTAYIIYRNGVVVGFTASTFFWSKGLSADTAYTYQVLAANSAGSSAKSASLSVTTEPSTSTNILGDVNGDKRVNIVDLSIILSNWGKANQTYQEGNIAGTTYIGIQDLYTVLTNYSSELGGNP